MAAVMPKKQEKHCFNCSYNRWQQPEDETSIQQCAKCKMVTYCSKECQKEHWHNVHKEHCKYLSKQKVLPKSWHDKAACLVCKEETAAGKIALSRPGNPVWACTLSSANHGPTLGSLPFPLAEMTGQFVSKFEATISIMMRLLLKMKLMGHPAWTMNSTRAELLYKELAEAREMCWKLFLIFKPGPRVDEASTYILNIICMVNIYKLTEVTDSELKAAKFVEQDEFKPWDTFLMLTVFLDRSYLDNGKRNAEYLGLPDKMEDHARIRITSAKFNYLWEKIVDKLQDRMVPFLTLVEVLCGGELSQSCYGCSEELTVGGVSYGINMQCVDGPVLVFGLATCLSVCGKLCLQQCRARILETEKDVEGTYLKIYAKYWKDRCDYCAMHYQGVRGKRCSRCLTKVYCGEDCRDQDWEVHKLVCREGEVERKKKTGQQERKQEGRDMINHLKEHGIL